MKRSDLKPGMKLRNKISKKIGEVRGKGNDELLCADKDYVAVRVRTATGKNKGKYQYPWWYLENLEIVD